MRMKMFSAETFEKAQALIQAEFGDDAIILSEREIDGRVEVRAAVDRRSVVRLPDPDRRPRPELAERPIVLDGLRHRLREILDWHGAPGALAELVANAAGRLVTGDTAPQQALTAGIEGIIACAPISAMPDRNIILVGPPGCGRTATTAKLTRRAAIAGHDLVPLAADFDATAGGAQLSAYLEREQHLVTSVRDPGELFSFLANFDSVTRRCVIDLPAINPFDREDLARLQDLLPAINAEPVLVMSAEGHPADLEDAARAFASLGIRRAIVTKLDVVRRRGGIFSAIAAARMSLSHIAVTPFIGGGLVPAAAGRIASLLIEDAPGHEALKGAA